MIEYTRVICVIQRETDPSGFTRHGVRDRLNVSRTARRGETREISGWFSAFEQFLLFLHSNLTETSEAPFEKMNSDAIL